jgi:hypothetical protein
MFELVVLLLFFIVSLVISNVIFIKRFFVVVDEHKKLGNFIQDESKKYEGVLQEQLHENDKLRAEYKLLFQTNEDNLKNLKEYDDFAKNFVKECEDYLTNYNDFYFGTLDDVASVLNMIDDLMKRQVITDDPDVQNFYRIVQILHDVLIGYTNAGNRGIGPKKEV